MDNEQDEQRNLERATRIMRWLVIAAIVAFILLAVWGAMVWYATYQYAIAGGPDHWR